MTSSTARVPTLAPMVRTKETGFLAREKVSDTIVGRTVRNTGDTKDDEREAWEVQAEQRKCLRGLLETRAQAWIRENGGLTGRRTKGSVTTRRHGQGWVTTHLVGAPSKRARQDGMKMGWGRLTIGKRTIPKPQVLRGCSPAITTSGRRGEEDLADANPPRAAAGEGKAAVESPPPSPLRQAMEIRSRLNSDDEAAAEAEAAEAERLEDLAYDELHEEQQRKATGVHFFKDELSAIQPRSKTRGSARDRATRK